MTDREGLVYDLPEAEYHGGPELSKSGMKALLRSPAHYQQYLARPEHKAAWDLGSVVHSLVLGTGWPVHVIEADDWRTKAAKEERDEARAAQKIPLLRKNYDQARATADAVLAHPTARNILTGGDPEVSLFWEDDSDGAHDPVPLRARYDYLHPLAGVDVKTCDDASRDGFTSSVKRWNYATQAFGYSDGFYKITGEQRPFLFVAVEVDPPYGVGVYSLPSEALAVGERRWRDALARYAACVANNEWPGYTTEIEVLESRWWGAA